MEKAKIILASKSPRRRELMEQIGIDFDVMDSYCNEQTDISDPEERCKALAEKKARNVARIIGNAARYTKNEEDSDGMTAFAKLEAEALTQGKDMLKGHSGFVIIGADTVVYAGGEIMEKPKGYDDAVRMLKMLSGRIHKVYTGVCIVRFPEGKAETFAECTEVEVAQLSGTDIKDYLATGEAYDKAGAYGIQGYFARYIKGIRGDYNNVVGLPVGRIYRDYLA